MMPVQVSAVETAAASVWITSGWSTAERTISSAWFELQHWEWRVSGICDGGNFKCGCLWIISYVLSKLMSWSLAAYLHRLTSHKRKDLNYWGENSNLAYWAGWLNGLEFWSVFWRKIRDSSVIIVTTLRDWRQRNRVSIVGKGKKCIPFRALVKLKRCLIEF